MTNWRTVPLSGERSSSARGRDASLNEFEKHLQRLGDVPGMRAQFVEQLAVSCCSMIGSISYDGCPSWDGLPLESSLGRAAAIRTPSIERNNMAQKGFEPVRKRKKTRIKSRVFVLRLCLDADFGHFPPSGKRRRLKQSQCRGVVGDTKCEGQ